MSLTEHGTQLIQEPEISLSRSVCFSHPLSFFLKKNKKRTSAECQIFGKTITIYTSGKIPIKSSGPEVIKLFPCSTQASKKF